jgi:hypothetical protein
MLGTSEESDGSGTQLLRRYLRCVQAGNRRGGKSMEALEDRDHGDGTVSSGCVVLRSIAWTKRLCDIAGMSSRVPARQISKAVVF